MGGSRSVSDLREIDGNIVTIGNIEEILDKIFGGDNVKHASVKYVAENLSLGHPSVATEPLGNNGHEVSILEISLNVKNNYESDAKVYNPQTGRIENRFNYFDPESSGSPPKRYPGSFIYIIKK